MTLYTSIYLLLKYDTTRLAVKIILKSEYGGGDIAQPAQLGRGTTGVGLRVIAPVAKKQWAGVFLLDKVPPVDVVTYLAEDYDVGTDKQIRLALRERYLQVKGFEDTAFWYAAWLDRRWTPDLAYEPIADKRQFRVRLVER